MTEYKTHFAGAARLIWEDAKAAMDVSPSSVPGEIAESLYDFVVFLLMYAPTSCLQHAASRREAEAMIKDMPDLIHWNVAIWPEST